ncbi:hypothetical protein EGP91_03840 [bacterium]|nr:hypothetical protein [bacterium]
MNYLFWSLPFLVIILLFAFYFGKIMLKVLPTKVKNYPLIYWISLIILIGFNIYLRTPLMGFLIYFTLFHMIYDLLRLLSYPFKKVNSFLKKINYKEYSILVISILFTLYGVLNAMHPVVTSYNVKVDKQVDEPIKIAFISDLHLGTPYLNENFQNLIKIVNGGNYDIFVLGGDIFDEWTTEKEKEHFFEILKEIKTKNGSYYIEGNHDVLNEETYHKYTSSGVRVLQNESLLIDNKYYLVGRKDRMTREVQGLEQMLKNVDMTLPIIVLEHQPTSVKELEENKVDLSISGHTHGGQIWPANYFVKYGYYDNGYSKSIISSGYGEWGMPIKTTYHSELVSITIY